MNSVKDSGKIILFVLTTLVAQGSFANEFVVQGGIFNASQGMTQNVGIQGLVGDQFTINRSNAKC